MKKKFAVIGGNGNSIKIRNYDGVSFKNGRRYGDDFIAEYFIEINEEGIPKLVKNENFKPYRDLGWGGYNPVTGKPDGIDWEASTVRTALGREPTEEDIKNYFEGARR